MQKNTRNITIGHCLFDKIKRRANSIARKEGHGRATEIVLGTQDRVISHTHFGHRKYTTGEYVPKSYLANFGWKNTYYQHAETKVEVNINK